MYWSRCGASWTVVRRRWRRYAASARFLVHAIHYAVERGELDSCPLARMRWRVPKPAVAVYPRVVANPYQAGDLLSTVSYVGDYRRARRRRLVGVFGAMYYAGLRPEEAVAVALPDCRLPRTGWRWLIVHRTLSQVGKRWTNTGHYHDERGLKNRPPGETQVVPHPVALWREHVATFDTADDGGCPIRSSVRVPYGSSRRPARRSPRSPTTWGHLTLAMLAHVFLAVMADFNVFVRSDLKRIVSAQLPTG